MLTPFVEQLRARYWPGVDQDFTVVAAKRSLAAFCLLAGSSGLAVTALNLRYLPAFADQIALGFVLSLVCIATPYVTNAAGDFLRKTHVMAVLAFCALASLCLMGGMLPNSPSLILIAMVLTFTLVFGLRVGLAYGVGAIAVYTHIYLTALLPSPPVALAGGATVDWTNVYTSMCIVMAFTVIGAAVFRREVVRATERLALSNAALEEERGSLELRVHQRTFEMEAALQAAESANAAKSQFLAVMSHELRTPLNAIIGYSELMMETAELDRRVDDIDDHRRVLRAARHLLGLVNEVLDLSKVEAGKLQLALSPVDLSEMLAETLEEVSVQAAARGNRLVARFSSDLGIAQTDAQKLRQCLLNLLSNAVKFTTDGTVEVRAERRGDMVFVEVEDSGIGIDEADLARLFEPFVQAESADTRRFGGTGLGLAVTRRLARLMEGDVTVVSVVGQGSTFTLAARAPLLPAASHTLAGRAVA